MILDLRGSQVDIRIAKGRSFLFSGVLEESGAAVDISGYEFRLIAKQAVTDQTPALSLDMATGIAITDAVNGRFSVTATAAETDALTADTSTVPARSIYQYEMDYRTGAAAEWQPFLYGSLLVEERT